MKSLISINKKFMSIHPKDLVEMIILSKYTKGVEIYVNINNNDELEYLDKLVYELKRYNLLLQIHGEIELDLDKQIKFIKNIENYSDYLNQNIVITMHSIYSDNKEESLNKTVDYLSKLLKEIDTNKVTISLENLNDINKLDRLNKEDITSSVLNDEKLYFTYDIGHEIADFGSITNLNKYMLEDIRNIHIHTISKEGIDHMPIYKNDSHINEIHKAIEYLIVNKYKYNIVFEYGIEYCHGNTLEEKLKDYLNSIDEVSEKFN